MHYFTEIMDSQLATTIYDDSHLLNNREKKTCCLHAAQHEIN